MISFTFDDFPRSALSEGGAILKQYGARGTYYVSMGLMGQTLPAGPGFLVEDLHEAISEGHELGCHTYSHCHAWDTKPRIFEQAIVDNREALEKTISGATFASLSYPIAFPRPGTKRRAGKHFACCRSGGKSINVGATDANNLQALFLEKHLRNPGELKNLIDVNSRSRGWLIFATHDICDAPSRFGCTPKFFEGIVRHASDSGARILPVGEAWALLRNQ